jgi:hypothetical protein
LWFAAEQRRLKARPRGGTIFWLFLPTANSQLNNQFVKFGESPNQMQYRTMKAGQVK